MHYKPRELSRKRKMKVGLSRLKNKKSKKQKKKKNSSSSSSRMMKRMKRMTDTMNTPDNSNSVERPKGLLFMLRTFFTSMFDPTVDGRIDRSLLSRGYISTTNTSTSHRSIYIPSRHNTYIPGGGRSISSISGSRTGMTGSGGGSYSATGGDGASAGPVCG